jgi:hypothetical protein
VGVLQFRRLGKLNLLIAHRIANLIGFLFAVGHRLANYFVITAILE